MKTDNKNNIDNRATKCSSIRSFSERPVIIILHIYQTFWRNVFHQRRLTEHFQTATVVHSLPLPATTTRRCTNNNNAFKSNANQNHLERGDHLFSRRVVHFCHVSRVSRRPRRVLTERFSSGSLNVRKLSGRKSQFLICEKKKKNGK